MTFRNSMQVLILSVGTCLTLPVMAQETLSLSQVISQAVQNDPWKTGNTLRQKAVKARSEGADTLPNPMVSVGLMNLPVDTFAFDQEAMTQMKVSVQQMLPRGDSLSIQRAQLLLQSTKFAALEDLRNVTVKEAVTQLWLNWYEASQALALINADTHLFEQMAEVAEAGYASALANTRQQDVIRAQLELVQLSDRLTVQEQKRDAAFAALAEWLELTKLPAEVSPPARLPPPLTTQADTHAIAEEQTLIAQLASHPQVQALDIDQQVAQKTVAIAREQHKPQWGVNASYAYRQDAPDGMSRSDFFSVGVTVDVPLFSHARQDSDVSASIAESEAIKTDKLLMIRKMLAATRKTQAELAHLHKRKSLYDEQLLTQTKEQAEASLTAYTNDDGDFAEVVRARVSQLNARLAALAIDTDIARKLALLDYYLSDVQPSHAVENNNE